MGKGLNMIFNKDIKIIRKIIFLISFIVFLFSGISLINVVYKSHKNKKLNDELSNTLSQIVENQSNKNNTDNRNLIQELLDINSDIKGSIKIENTKINYPVVQCENNEFYIKNDIKKNESKYGTIFIDYRNKLTSNSLSGQNIVLYGHNMKDGSMFADLKGFRDREFFNNNNVIELTIFPEKYKFQVFSVLIIEADFDYRKTFFNNSKDMDSYLKRIQKSALYFKDTELNCKDTIITLSTCSYERENSRIVVQGKLIKD